MEVNCQEHLQYLAERHTLQTSLKEARERVQQLEQSLERLDLQNENKPVLVWTVGVRDPHGLCTVCSRLRHVGTGEVQAFSSEAIAQARIGQGIARHNIQRNTLVVLHEEVPAWATVTLDADASACAWHAVRPGRNCMPVPAVAPPPPDPGQVEKEWVLRNPYRKPEGPLYPGPVPLAVPAPVMLQPGPVPLAVPAPVMLQPRRRDAVVLQPPPTYAPYNTTEAQRRAVLQPPPATYDGQPRVVATFAAVPIPAAACNTE